MVDKAHMREACPHIDKAQRMLEMLRLFAENRENLSLAKRVPTYYQGLVDSVIEIQRILLTDNEYTERMGWSLAHVNRKREYAYNVTQNNNGEVFYDVDALLPLKEMKKNVLVSGRRGHGI
jgi:hypothetical protein